MIFQGYGSTILFTYYEIQVLLTASCTGAGGERLLLNIIRNLNMDNGTVALKNGKLQSTFGRLKVTLVSTAAMDNGGGLARGNNFGQRPWTFAAYVYKVVCTILCYRHLER